MFPMQSGAPRPYQRPCLAVSSQSSGGGAVGSHAALNATVRARSALAGREGFCGVRFRSLTEAGRGRCVDQR
jgi:hypothetical protein